MNLNLRNLALLLILLSSTATAQTDSFWLQGDGSWSANENWDNGIPNGWFTANLVDSAGQITQDMSNLQIAGLVIDSSTANLVLDQSLSVSSLFIFNEGNISGPNDLNLLPGAIASLQGPAVFSGEGSNGGGVFRVQGTATVDETFTSNGFFELSGASARIAGDGALFLNNSFTWSGGIMTGSGTTHLNQGALISDGLLDRKVENRAGLIVTGNGLKSTANGVWKNIGPDAIFKISGDQNLLGDGTFLNEAEAFLKKSGGTGTSIIEWDVFHEGNMILVESGELSLRGDAFLNSQLMIMENATLDLRGNATFGPEISHAENGTLKLSGGSARFDHLYNGHLNTVLTGSSTILGKGDIHFHRNFDAITTSIIGSGTLNLHGDSKFSIVDLQRTTNNFGVLTLNNSLISTTQAGDFTNQWGGIVEFGGFNNAVVGIGQFKNAAGGQVSTTAGNNSWLEWNFQNDGDISVANQSRLSFRGNFQQGATGTINLDEGTIEFRGTHSTVAGRLTGNGVVDTRESELVVQGLVAPGNEVGQLNVLGNVQFTDDTEFVFELGPGFAADMISVTGDLVLDGSLEIIASGEVTKGKYNLFSYDGQLFDTGLDLSLPSSLQGMLFHDATNGIIGLNVTSVPEPNLVAMVMTIAMAVGMRRRIRESTG